MIQYRVGDLVVYQMTKQSSHPTLRATTITPAAHGDNYCYVVEKFWVVREILDDHTLSIQTRRGKTRLIQADDPCLRKASWWDRWVHRDRFPKIDDPTTGNTPPSEKSAKQATSA